MKKIILASTSPIRKEMLTKADIVFEAIAPLCDEDSIKLQKKHLKLADMALELAKAKAKGISAEFPEAFVIGSDQICEFEEESISKAKDAEDAFKTLRKLAGKKHIQNNGTCVYLGGKCVHEFKDSAFLTMKPLNEQEIIDYIQKDNPVGCAGSYKFELNGKYLFDNIEGNYECIQGFGLSSVVDFLNKSAR